MSLKDFFIRLKANFEYYKYQGNFILVVDTHLAATCAAPIPCATAWL